MTSIPTVYKQHDDHHILIPQHISRRAFISATFLLNNSILAYVLNYPVLSILSGLLYITTLLHWNAVKHWGIIRIIDAILANTTILYLTFISSAQFCPIYQQYMFYVAGFVGSSFAINKYMLHMQVTYYSNRIIYIGEYETWPLTLLNYTNPNTYTRELAYIRNVYIHMFCVHIFPSIMSSIFVILSHYQCNWKCE